MEIYRISTIYQNQNRGEISRKISKGGIREYARLYYEIASNSDLPKDIRKKALENAINGYLKHFDIFYSFYILEEIITGKNHRIKDIYGNDIKEYASFGLIEKLKNLYYENFNNSPFLKMEILKILKEIKENNSFPENARKKADNVYKELKLKFDNEVNEKYRDKEHLYNSIIKELELYGIKK